jgi:hypothetical protein
MANRAGGSKTKDRENMHVRYHEQHPGAPSSVAQHTLQAFDISTEEIARHCGLSTVLVDAALHPRRMADCPIITVFRVQGAAEACLRRRGWRGKTDHLWREYHELVRQTAAKIAEHHRHRPLANILR